MALLVSVTVLMPERLAKATLAAAEATGQREGDSSIRLEHFVILSERAFEKLLGCGGAGEGPERAANPAPVAGTGGVPAMT